MKKTVSRNAQVGNNSSSGIKDLREKLSGPTAPPQSHPQVVTKLQQRTSSAMKPVAPKITTVPVTKPSVAAAKPPVVPKVSTMVNSHCYFSFSKTKLISGLGPWKRFS